MIVATPEVRSCGWSVVAGSRRRGPGRTAGPSRGLDPQGNLTDVLLDFIDAIKAAMQLVAGDERDTSNSRCRITPSPPQCSSSRRTRGTHRRLAHRRVVTAAAMQLVAGDERD